MARQRLIRGDPPPPEGAVLVRALYDTYPYGRVFARDVLIADVTYNFDVFGYHGLSVWLVSATWPLERVLREKARKARRVAVFSVGVLLEQRLGLVPSGKAPHYDTTHGSVYGRTYGASRLRLAARKNSSTGS